MVYNAGDANIPQQNPEKGAELEERQAKGIHFADVMNAEGNLATGSVQGDVSTVAGTTPELAQLGNMVARGEEVVAKRGDMTASQLQAAVGANENAITQAQQLIGDKSAALDAHSAQTGLG